MVTHYFESHRSGIELIAGRLIRELVRLEQEVVWVASNVTPLRSMTNSAAGQWH
jgi:hypothetical protein